MRIRAESKNIPISCKSISTSNKFSCYTGRYQQKALENIVLLIIQPQADMAEDTIKQLKRANQTLNIPKLRYWKKEYEKN